MTDYLKHRNDLDNPDFASIIDELSFWSSRFGRLLFDQIEIRGGIEILDVGCGNGFPLFELAHVFGRSCRVTGFDIWKAALARVRLKQRLYDLPNVNIVEADGARQPFTDSSFDLIVSNLGLNNWSDPSGVLAECFRVAKPGAKLALTTNVVGHYREFYEVFRETLREMDRAEYLEGLNAQEAHRGTLLSLGGLLREAGWTIVKEVEDEFQMRFTDGSALLNHSLTKIGFLGGWRSVVKEDEEGPVFERIEGKLNETAKLRGELRMSVPMLYLEAEKAIR
ncbi:MAG TPA: class I SAM-dependent methyltransferase [Pyrinomonadaceae bacterium]|jgi:SAM-dependent methyltransferase|nr:class I SAM-dependent methyltransferase [Pyrinomonadaceae bacterium]